MEPIVSSETSASNTQTPGSYPKESLLHLQHGENLNLKSRIVIVIVVSCDIKGLTDVFAYQAALEGT
jgi:hypothetical protein